MHDLASDCVLALMLLNVPGNVLVELPAWCIECASMTTVNTEECITVTLVGA